VQVNWEDGEMSMFNNDITDMKTDISSLQAKIASLQIDITSITFRLDRQMAIIDKMVIRINESQNISQLDYDYMHFVNTGKKIAKNVCCSCSTGK
jgi:hypothetical protein